MARVSGRAYDGQLIIPAFFEAGRVTIGNTHYMVEGEQLISVHETEFAKDKVFGYEHGDLPSWVEEKTSGRIKASRCLTISLEEIRQGVDIVKVILLKAESNVPIIVNALSYADMDVLSLALLQAEDEGKLLFFGRRPPLSNRMQASRIRISAEGKLIASGQENMAVSLLLDPMYRKRLVSWNSCLRYPGIKSLEINVDACILDPDPIYKRIDRVIGETNKYLATRQQCCRIQQP